MSGFQVIKLTDFIRDVGEDEARRRLSSFSSGGLNNEVEEYLRDAAFRHSRKKTSITYLVMANGDTHNCLAYYTLAVKPFSIRLTRLTARQKNAMKDLARISISKEEKHHGISSYLIAQLAKNYALEDGKLISGRDLVGFILDQIRGILSRRCERQGGVSRIRERQAEAQGFLQIVRLRGIQDAFRRG